MYGCGIRYGSAGVTLYRNVRPVAPITINVQNNVRYSGNPLLYVVEGCVMFPSLCVHFFAHKLELGRIAKIITSNAILLNAKKCSRDVSRCKFTWYSRIISSLVKITKQETW